MKKLSILAITFVFLAALFTSCKSHQRCAAYGKVQPKNVQTPS